MKRPTILLLGIVAIAIAAYAGYRMSASDETRIRWLLGDAADSFNHTRLSGCIGAFDKDYQDTTTRIDRANLASVLRYLFLKRVDPKTKAFLHRVLMPEESMSIEIADAGQEAEVKFDLDLQQQQGETWQSTWQLRVTAQLHKVDGDWRIRQSSHETAMGKPPR